ncbi:MAG: formate dehydrogenase subunit delta [Novosphingobium sp.]|nr:formate dehydrogenase subunit delta [Novosphingobium sp.]
MSAHTTEKLVYMANQIARNVALEADPVAMVADHIQAFWSPRMKTDVFAAMDRPEGAGLEPTARAALERLAAHAA